MYKNITIENQHIILHQFEGLHKLWNSLVPYLIKIMKTLLNILCYFLSAHPQGSEGGISRSSRAFSELCGAREGERAGDHARLFAGARLCHLLRNARLFVVKAGVFREKPPADC